MKKLPLFAKEKENFLALEDSLQGFEEFVSPQPIDQTFTSSHYCMGILLESDLLNKKIMESLKALGVGIFTTTSVPHDLLSRKYGSIDCPNSQSM